MCCFTAPTHVEQTQIFARFVRPGTQALAYHMTYEATSPTAMILPVPIVANAKEDSLRFKNLKGYTSIFEDLHRGFPEKPAAGMARGMKSAAAAAEPVLAVHDIGDFVASFVPSIRDFARIDPRFVIKKELWQAFPAYDKYGFAVFQLKELAASSQPMAFEFDTASIGQLFFPTVHIHDGTVHAEEDFDHVLYMQDASLDAADAKSDLVRSEAKLATFADGSRADGLLDPALYVHKKTLGGRLPNRDTLVDIGRAASTTASHGCGRCDVGPGASFGSLPLPIGLGIAGLGWVMRRRDLLGRTR